MNWLFESLRKASCCIQESGNDGATFRHNLKEALVQLNKLAQARYKRDDLLKQFWQVSGVVCVAGVPVVVECCNCMST